jgi:hypothetical protein
MIRTVAEAFLVAVQAQTQERAPPPKVYRAEGDLRDVQIIGQIDILAAIEVALTTLRIASDEMAKAGSAYDDRSQHLQVDGIWTTMMDVALQPDSDR